MAHTATPAARSRRGFRWPAYRNGQRRPESRHEMTEVAGHGKRCGSKHPRSAPASPGSGATSAPMSNGSSWQEKARAPRHDQPRALRPGAHPASASSSPARFAARMRGLRRCIAAAQRHERVGQVAERGDQHARGAVKAGNGIAPGQPLAGGASRCGHPQSLLQRAVAMPAPASPAGPDRNRSATTSAAGRTAAGRCRASRIACRRTAWPVPATGAPHPGSRHPRSAGCRPNPSSFSARSASSRW